MTPRAANAVSYVVEGGAQARNTERIRILVVEDDDVDRMSVRRTLSRAGVNAEVREASTAAQAKALVKEFSFDCILLDYDIPGSDGLSMIGYIREMGVTAPVVMLTGAGDEEVAVGLMKAGAVDYLSKSALTSERLASSLRYSQELTRAVQAAAHAEQELRDSVERARHLADEALRARNETERMQRLVESLASVMSTDEVADTFVQQVHEAMDVSTTWVGVVDCDRTYFRTVAHTGYPKDRISKWLRFPVSMRTPASICFYDATPRWYSSQSDLVADFPDAADNTPLYQSLAVLPLKLGEEAFGVVTLGFSDAKMFTPEDRALALALSRQCALALERSRLYDAERHARREAVEANRAKSEFLARMSHDLRTPLNAIGGFTQLLELGVQGAVSESQLDSLARIRRAQEHLLTLINDILGFARIEAGQVRLELTAVPIDKTLRSVTELIEPQARARGLEFTYNSPSDEMYVIADRERLVQVMLNLLTNALKFTESPGSVTLSWSRNLSKAIITVADTGRGISAGRLDSIFDPFVQETRLPNDNIAGVGLGLAISRDLARMMNADLTVESSLGSGSIFTLVMQEST